MEKGYMDLSMKRSVDVNYTVKEKKRVVEVINNVWRKNIDMKWKSSATQKVEIQTKGGSEAINVQLYTNTL